MTDFDGRDAFETLLDKLLQSETRNHRLEAQIEALRNRVNTAESEARSLDLGRRELAAEVTRWRAAYPFGLDAPQPPPSLPGNPSGAPTDPEMPF